MSRICGYDGQNSPDLYEDGDNSADIEQCSQHTICLSHSQQQMRGICALIRNRPAGRFTLIFTFCAACIIYDYFNFYWVCCVVMALLWSYRSLNLGSILVAIHFRVSTLILERWQCSLLNLYPGLSDRWFPSSRFGPSSVISTQSIDIAS